MEDSTTQYLSYFFIFVIVVSLASIGLEITGRVTDIATLNVTVTTTASINFSVDNVNFGSGTVDAGSSFAYIFNEGPGVVDGSWTPVGTYFVLENVGNVNVSLNVSASNNAASFIGGTSPSYTYRIVDNETNSCTGEQTAYIPLNESKEFLDCTVLEFVEARDTVNLYVNLTIPQDSNQGTLNSTITAEATAV